MGPALHPTLPAFGRLNHTAVSQGLSCSNPWNLLCECHCSHVGYLGGFNVITREAEEEERDRGEIRYTKRFEDIMLLTLKME